MRIPLAAALVLGLSSASAPLRGCARRILHPRSRPPAAAPSSVDRAPAFRLPLPRPGTAAVAGMERDIPLTWIYLVEDPVPTGSAPNAIVGAALPCGYRPVFATVEPYGAALNLLVRTRYAGPGAPPSPDGPQPPCAAPETFVDYVSLSRVRLGEYRVGDGVTHGPSDPPPPFASLRVVPDDERTPARAVRRTRGCAPGDDATCRGGGVCGALAGRAVGVCVPPLDPRLHDGQPCAADAVEVAVEHAPSGVVRACLLACRADGGCDPGLACVDLGGRAACVPEGPTTAAPSDAGALPESHGDGATPDASARGGPPPGARPTQGP